MIRLYTEYKGVLKLDQNFINHFFSLMWVYSVLMEIINYDNNFDKINKEKVIDMKKTFKIFLVFYIILQGASMFLYL